MLANLYWLLVVAVLLGVFYLISVRLGKLKIALIVALVMGVLSHSFYYFYLEQILVKSYGGSMSLNVPDGQRHIGVTWKGDNLWLQNYNPATNECIFREYSRGSVLEGEVRIRNCNPLHLLKEEERQQLPVSDPKPSEEQE
ncbi:hypothetical protein SAMN05660443_1696 [Marinospirillum celere]|uniref:Uncharacterized protein n=1 Tax=Marinospirillum celere TaxID=1122252 RepID=A0A1I1GZ47_9GAMM|nr:hypothetical protein [Marinospirillum celere]SFC16562.1 hypothetical protein SAMN05660443_1696 [Marinospirillum celere]